MGFGVEADPEALAVLVELLERLLEGADDGPALSPREVDALLERVLHDFGCVDAVARVFNALGNRLLEESQEVLLCHFPSVLFVLIWVEG